MNKKLSTCFLISVYINDCFKDFEKAINSCLNQTVLPQKIIVVFDGEVKDSIYEFCNSIKSQVKINLVKCPKNVGLGSALNKGLGFVKEDVVIRMDSDDISRKNRVEKIIEFFRKNKEIGIVGSYISEFKETKGDIEMIRKVPLSSDLILKELKFSCPFNHVSVAFNYKFLPKNPYRVNYNRLEDYPTWYSLLIKYKLKPSNIDEVLVDVKLGENFLERRTGFKLFKSWFKVYKTMFNDGFISFFIFIRNSIIRFIQFNLIPKKILLILYSFNRK